MSATWLTVGTHPQVLSALEASLEDLKTLARLDPEEGGEYRQRFDGLAALSQRLKILEHNREAIVDRYQAVLLAAFALISVAITAFWLARQKRDEARLSHLQVALTELAAGRTDLHLGEHRRDTLGRIALMIERTSRRMARDQKRLAALRNLSAWQEAARRHAHEMRTPLTGARLELGRLGNLVGPQRFDADQARAITHTLDSIGQEIDRLARFTQQFTSFAKLPRPRLEVRDLSRLVAAFVTTFEAAWPVLELRFEVVAEGEPTVEEASGASRLYAAVDGDMVRQVLVNLCDNSALAITSQPGESKARSPLTLRLGTASGNVVLDVADGGPGIAEEIKDRLFEPYTTTRSIGEGMGLGLAICRKILLDHGGDLELIASSSQGTAFRLSFPQGETTCDGDAK